MAKETKELTKPLITKNVTRRRFSEAKNRKLKRVQLKGILFEPKASQLKPPAGEKVCRRFQPAAISLL